MIHKSWKRIEILNIIDKIGLDIKQYSYLHKDECLKKFTEYIKSENLNEFEYLFKPKPIKKFGIFSKVYINNKKYPIDK